MGMNFYLYKKDNSKWVVPSNRLGDSLERLCVQTYKTETDKTIALNLEKCVEEVEGLHIGKSSMGWHFGLCIYPSLNIYNLKDWNALFENSDYTIKDEEDKEISREEMLDRITNRRAYKFDEFDSIEEYEKNCVESANKFEEQFANGKPKHFDSYDDYLARNHAGRGYNGLLSHITSVWDERENDVWKDFLPMITNYIKTDGTYDLTPDWDFS